MALVSGFRSRITRWLLGILVGIPVILGLIFGGVYLLDPYRLCIAPDVSVDGVVLSGLNPLAAHDALETALADTLYSEDLTVTLPREVLTFSPGETNPTVDTWKAVYTAFLFGRKDVQQENQLSLTPFLSLNDSVIRNALEGYAEKYNTDFSETAWSLTGDAPHLGTGEFDPDQQPQAVTITLGTPEETLDTQEVFSQCLSLYGSAISACRENRFGVSASADALRLPQMPDLEAIRQAVSSDPVNDSLDLETYAFVPGSYGQTFSLEEAEKLLAEADYGDTVTVPLSFQAPEILGEGVYFRDVLGTCETKHNNNENRNTNLRLLCAALDGQVVQPGETFSYNDTLGERTREKGYLPAPAYSGNRLVDAIGGGVCQGSTTLYNCVLLADLEVVERACHGASVGYVPAGLDAAVNFLTTDFRFRNNFHFPVKLQAEVSDGYVRMQILGTDEKDYYIEMRSAVGEDEIATYARSYKFKYSKETGELLSKDLEAFSTYYKNIG